MLKFILHITRWVSPDELSAAIALFQRHCFHEIRTPKAIKHARLLEIRLPQIRKPMKLPQPAKGINLGRALVWPSHFGASICDNSLLRVSQTLLDSFRLLGNLHWFPYLGQSSFLEPSMAAESFRVPPTL